MLRLARSVAQTGGVKVPGSPDPNEHVRASERDLRSYARTTLRRLGWGAGLLLVAVGTILVVTFQGAPAGVGALLCFGVVLIPVGLILAALQLIDWVARRARGD